MEVAGAASRSAASRSAHSRSASAALRFFSASRSLARGLHKVAHFPNMAENVARGSRIAPKESPKDKKKGFYNKP
jgi:hypothetical protein